MGVGTILLVVFVVMPAVQWTLWGGKSGRRRSRNLGDLHPDEVAARRGELEELQARVGELENRLDFAERLLAQREPPVLAKPPGT